MSEKYQPCYKCIYVLDNRKGDEYQVSTNKKIKHVQGGPSLLLVMLMWHLGRLALTKSTRLLISYPSVVRMRKCICVHVSVHKNI